MIYELKKVPKHRSRQKSNSAKVMHHRLEVIYCNQEDIQLGDKHNGYIDITGWK